MSAGFALLNTVRFRIFYIAGRGSAIKAKPRKKVFSRNSLQSIAPAIFKN